MDQANEKLNKETKDVNTELLLLEEELKIALLKAEEEHALEHLNITYTLVLHSKAKMKDSGVEL